jgi:hypothetical protein
MDQNKIEKYIDRSRMYCDIKYRFHYSNVWSNGLLFHLQNYFDEAAVSLGLFGLSIIKDEPEQNNRTSRPPLRTKGRV